MTGILFTFLGATLVSQSFMDAMSVVIGLYILTMYFKKQAHFQSILPPNSKKELIFISLWLLIVAAGLFGNSQFLTLFLEWKWMLNLYFMYWFLNLYFQRRAMLEGDFSQALGSNRIAFWQPLHWTLIVCFIYGAVSYITQTDLATQTPLTHGDRFAGALNDPMNFSHIYSMYTVFLSAFLFQCFADWKNKFFSKHQALLMVTLIVTALSVYLSFTRGAWVGLFLGAAVVFFVYNWRWGIGLIAAGVLSAGVLYSGSEKFRNRIDQAIYPSHGYDSERYNLWRANIEMFKDHPIVGVGHGDYKKHLPYYFEKLGIPADHFQSHAHNQYIQALSNTGLMGFLFYMTFLITMLVITYRGYTATKNPVLLGSLGAQIVFHVGAFTECNFERAKVRLVFLFFCALALSIVHQKKPAPSK